jgi:hypothetical protein
MKKAQKASQLGKKAQNQLSFAFCSGALQGVLHSALSVYALER